MSTIRNSASNTQPARLPPLAVPPGVDAAMRQFLEAVKERLEVRDGARGNPYERAATVRDLMNLGVDVTSVGNQVVPGSPGRRIGSGGSSGGGGTSVSLADIEALISSSLSAEAARLGASIRRVEHRLQTETESSASVLTQITAAIGQATAGVREFSYANATATNSVAGKVTKLVATVGENKADFEDYIIVQAGVNEASADKTTRLTAAVAGVGSASFDQSISVIASRTEGLKSQFMLNVTAGGVVSGIKLLASEDPNGISNSAFIVEASQFKVLTSGGGRSPFGTDGANIFLDGTVRINAGGQSLLTLAENAAVAAITYVGEFASAPGTAGRKKNQVYRNTADGNLYILTADNGAWTLYVPKGTDGKVGARGSLTLYLPGTFSPDAATSAFNIAAGTPQGTPPSIGDTVTYTSGSGASAVSTTRYWGGSQWLAPGVVIDGNLLVGGSISSSSVDTSQYVKAQGFIDEGADRASVLGLNSSHNGFAVAGISTTTNANGGGYFRAASKQAVLASCGSFGVGVLGEGFIGIRGNAFSFSAGTIGVDGISNNNIGVQGQGPIGVSCQGSFKFGPYLIPQPDGVSSTQFLSRDGTWRTPTSSGTTWNSITGKPAQFPPTVHQHFLHDIVPGGGDGTYAFSTDGGSTWTPVLLRKT